MARTLSLGVIQTSYGEDMDGQHRQDRRLRAGRRRRSGRAGGPAVRAVPGAVLLRHPGRALVRHRPSLARAPVRHRAGAAGGRAGRGDPHLDLRARGAALLQQPGDGRRGRLAARASTARATSPTGRATRRSTTSGPGDTGFKRVGARATDGSAWASAGTSGSRRPRAPWSLAGAEVLLYPTAIGSEPHDSSSLDTRDPWRRAMQGHAVSNVIPVAAANRIGHEPGAGGRADLLRLVVPGRPSRRPRAAEPGARGGGRAHGELRPRLPAHAPRRLGLLPRPPHRPVRGAGAAAGVWRLRLGDERVCGGGGFCRRARARRTQGYDSRVVGGCAAALSHRLRSRVRRPLLAGSDF